MWDFYLLGALKLTTWPHGKGQEVKKETGFAFNKKLTRQNRIMMWKKERKETRSSDTKSDFVTHSSFYS